MAGIRLIGNCARLFLVFATPNEIVPLADKIAALSCTGAIKEDFRPLTLIGMDQLARLTFNLLVVPNRDIDFAADELRREIGLVAKVFLNVPDIPLAKAHSNYLAPYYSMTASEALPQWLIGLTNNLAKAQPDDVKAISIINNIKIWAEDLYQTQKELLLLAIEKRSHFAFDLIRWITHVTKLLAAIAQVPACKQFPRDKIIDHTNWLLSVLSFIPQNDPQTVGFLENLGLTETLFQAAADAVALDCRKVFENAREQLEKWAFSAGRHHVGWSILERSLLALAILALSLPTEEAANVLRLKRTISIALQSPESPDQELRDRTARDLRSKAQSLNWMRHPMSRIEFALQDIDRAKMRTLLVEIADLLSPVTAGERVSTYYY